MTSSSGCRATTTSSTRARHTSLPWSGLGADPAAVLDGLAGFTGARRRFEVRARWVGVTVVDDYAHNPAKVAAVVGTAADIVHRAGAGRCTSSSSRTCTPARVTSPRTSPAALAPADHVVLLDVYGAREEPVDGSDLRPGRRPARRRLPGERTVARRADPGGGRGLDGAGRPTR